MSVNFLDVFANVQATLDGNVVGYACTIGQQTQGNTANGFARTAADGTPRKFLSSTKISVGSVSKLITALAAIRFIGLRSPFLVLDAKIGQWLPSDWNVDQLVKDITFRELLSHTSGIKEYGNSGGDYAGTKDFFTQSLWPYNSDITSDKSYKYSNWNYTIFRVLLPMIAGTKKTTNDFGIDLANAYVKICQDNVFNLVSALNVVPKPPTTGPQATQYALAYRYPGTDKGYDWGDETSVVGAVGWWLSIEDISKVLHSLNVRDEKILTNAQLDDMIATKMGFDSFTDNPGFRWIEKNGGWSANNTDISTTVALFGPNLFGAIFMNSDLAGPGLQSFWQWCDQCNLLTYIQGPNLGPCPGGPAGGMHTHKNSDIYMVPAGGWFGTSGQPPNSQADWRWCIKCQALAFAGNADIGACAAGGQHATAGSANHFVKRNTGSRGLHDQVNWRWCSKCQCLGYGNATPTGKCAKGGDHDYTTVGSGDYMLSKTYGADTVLYDAYKKAIKP